MRTTTTAVITAGLLAVATSAMAQQAPQPIVNPTPGCTATPAQMEEVRKAGLAFTRGTGALCEFSRRTSGVPFRVVLSHATREQDRILRKALGDAWRTIVLGGHDHHIHWAERDSRPPLYKNRSNLETVRVLLLLAGGDFAMQQLNDSYERIKTRLGSPPLFDAATVDALTTLESLPPHLRPQVTEVSAATLPDIRLTLVDGRQVLWGSVEESEHKAAILGPLLGQPGQVFDVSSPDLPTVK